MSDANVEAIAIIVIIVVGSILCACLCFRRRSDSTQIELVHRGTDWF